MTKVLLTGERTALGRRVADRLAAVGVDVAPLGTAGAAGADVVVHLVPGSHDAVSERSGRASDGTAELLGQLSEAGVGHLVLLSSAMVYGAWPNNPVPLTEGSPIRPDSAFDYARDLAQVEHAVDDWRAASPDRTVTVLRPVLSLASEGTAGIARALAAGMGERFGEDDAPAQFLHLDDLAAAVELGVTARLDGVYNVAPDGWIPGERVRALSGSGWRLKLPGRAADLVAGWRWQFQRGPIPPGLRPYTRSPWLVANDRLKAAGWSPSVTNEQAYVEGTEAKWWHMLSPKRKQEVSLGAMVSGIVVLVATIGWVVRRLHRRHRATRGVPRG